MRELRGGRVWETAELITGLVSAPGRIQFDAMLVVLFSFNFVFISVAMSCNVLKEKIWIFLRFWSIFKGKIGLLTAIFEITVFCTQFGVENHVFNILV